MRNGTGTERTEEEVMTTAEVEVMEEGTDEVEEIISDEVHIELYRKKNVRDGNTYNYYYIPISVFGKKMEIEIRPKGNKSATTATKVTAETYERINLIFDAHKAETGMDTYYLTVKSATMVDNNGKRSKYMTYTVTKRDPATGLELSVAMEPYGSSNKRLVDSLYEQKRTF